MRCLVTGAAGFVGSSLCDELLAQGHDVVGVDCFLDYYPREIKEANLTKARSHSKFSFVEQSILDPGFEATAQGAEWVFHQAAQAGVRASWGDYFSTYTNNNISATQRLLEMARNGALRESLKKIVYASSSSVYGTAECLPTSEQVIPCPVSPYGVTKLAAEHLMVLYAKEFQVPTVSLRYFTVYGPRQRPDMAFHRFIKAALARVPITLYDDGEQTRDFTYVDDIVSANISAAMSDSSELVFNVGGGSRVSINEVIKKLEVILGQSIAINYQARQKGDARHTASQSSLARRELGYLPKTALADGLVKEAEWFSAAFHTR